MSRATRRRATPATRNELSKKIAADSGVAVNDLYGLAIADREQLQGFANLHFTPAGSQLMGQQSPRGFRSPSANSRVPKNRRHTQRNDPVPWSATSPGLQEVDGRGPARVARLARKQCGLVA